MDVAILLLLSAALGCGVAGGLLSAWTCHRRVLALEQNWQIVIEAHEKRLNQLAEMVVKEQKREAAKVRWSKKELEDEAALKTLTDGGPAPVGHPWDPRTWGVNG